MQSDKNHAEITLGLDIGGSFIKSVLLRDGEFRELPIRPSFSNGGKDEIIAAIQDAIAAAGKVSRIGVSIPGPLDYRQGVSLMKHKFAAIYQLDLRTIFGGIAASFIHDANAFLLAELYGTDYRKAGGITLGTGIGAAFIDGGRFLNNELGSPSETVSLWQKPYKDGIVEDYISARAILNYYPCAGAKKAAEHARAGEIKALQAYEEFGKDLANILTAWHERLRPEIIIVGGQISKDFELFGKYLNHLPVRSGKFGGYASAYGAALYNFLNP